MAIAIQSEHRELAETARAFLRDRHARAANRALLEAPDEPLPDFWADFAALGLLGLHLPEEYGGGGAGLPELVVVVEELGRVAAPGPAVPTMMASAIVAATGTAGQKSRLLPDLASGAKPGAVALVSSVTLDGGVANGDAVVFGGGLADVFLIAAGDDLLIVPARAAGVSVEVPRSLDPARRSAKVRLDGVKVSADDVLTGVRPHATAIARTLIAAEATGGALECVETASGYAKVREQFGRVIGMFQAVKHHCANMLVRAELATAATWDAARAASDPLDQFELAAATALTLAVPAYTTNASMNIQVHGGIGFTWEHDAHLLLRRALTLEVLFSPEAAARDVTRLSVAGVARESALDLPADAEAARPEVRALAEEVAALPAREQRQRLIETGYVQPHWPRPWGIEANAGLQLVIEDEFKRAGVKRPNLGITSWNILTVIQHGTIDQIDRWVAPALAGDEIWCQLFSEPAAGSDAAGARTRGVRVEGGWRVNGQKVWTSDAHRSQWGLATVRTDPDAPKHNGITMMVIDMHGPGVEVRPLRQTTGFANFNEVFFTDVFVPDSDVVGTPNAGWKVARATLGNERVTIGGGFEGFEITGLLEEYTRHGERMPAAAERLGNHAAEASALKLLNLRRAERAVSGGEPGPEGNITKLVLANHSLDRADLMVALAGADAAFAEGDGALAGFAALSARALSIAGGTSEITRNQIGERILGLPRDPLIQ